MHWGRRTCSCVQNEILIGAEGVAFFKHHGPQTATRKLPKLFLPFLQMHWWLIHGETEIATNSTAGSWKEPKEILTNLEELSFRTVLAFPKAGEREKQMQQENLSVKTKYPNAKISRSAYIFKGITDFSKTMPCSLNGHQTLGTECDRRHHKLQKPIEVQRSFVWTLSLFKKAEEKYTRGNGSKTKLYPH